MREIKFRAWDKDNKRFQYNLFFRIDGKDEITTTYYVFQQYTGLKDKNGIEIYEGDILQMTNEYLTTYTKEVKWVDDEARFSFGTRADKTHLFYNTEVIGNIYENPKLLRED